MLIRSRWFEAWWSRGLGFLFRTSGETRESFTVAFRTSGGPRMSFALTLHDQHEETCFSCCFSLTNQRTYERNACYNIVPSFEFLR